MTGSGKQEDDVFEKAEREEGGVHDFRRAAGSASIANIGPKCRNEPNPGYSGIKRELWETEQSDLS
jgi:hypothetical protein